MELFLARGECDLLQGLAAILTALAFSTFTFLFITTSLVEGVAVVVVDSEEGEPLTGDWLMGMSVV
jgi:hypothetical protein